MQTVLDDRLSVLCYVCYVYHLSPRDTLGMSYSSEEIGRGVHKRQKKERKQILLHTCYMLRSFPGIISFNS